MYTLNESDSDHIKAVVGNMLFMVWVLRTDFACYHRGAEIVRMLGPRFPMGIGVCNVVEQTAVPPDGRTRSEFAQFLRLPEVKHFSVTHEGEGFKAAAVRAIVSAAQVIAAPAFPHAVHRSISEAGGWHSNQQRRIGVDTTTSEIEYVIADLRQQHSERYAERSF